MRRASLYTRLMQLHGMGKGKFCVGKYEGIFGAKWLSTVVSNVAVRRARAQLSLPVHCIRTGLHIRCDTCCPSSSPAAPQQEIQVRAVAVAHRDCRLAVQGACPGSCARAHCREISTVPVSLSLMTPPCTCTGASDVPAWCSTLRWRGASREWATCRPVWQDGPWPGGTIHCHFDSCAAWQRQHASSRHARPLRCTPALAHTRHLSSPAGISISPP